MSTLDIDKTQNKTSLAPEQRVISMWNRLGKSAVGRKLFNFLFARAVPYSGSIKSEVTRLEPGFVLVELKDRKRVRNHLNSIHAIALANLGELASGLAMIAALPPNTLAIVVNLEIEYLKKARGLLVAEGTASPPEVITESINSIALAEIKDTEGDVVSLVKVHWRLTPKEPKATPSTTPTNTKDS